MKIEGRVVNGKFIPHCQALFDNNVSKLNGKFVTLTLVEYRDSAHARQHRYYRGGIVSWVCKHYLQYITTDQFHAYYRWKFLTEYDETLGIEVTRSSSSLNTKEFAEFTEKVRMDLRSPDNKWGESIDTADPEEYFRMKAEGTWE